MLDRHTYVYIRQFIVEYLGKRNLPSTVLSKSSEIQIETFHSFFFKQKKERLNIMKIYRMIIIAVQWSVKFDPNSMCKIIRDQCG